MLALFVFVSFEFQLQLVHHQQHWHRQPHPVSITAISGPLYNKKKWTTATKEIKNALYSDPKDPINDSQQLRIQQLHKSGR